MMIIAGLHLLLFPCGLLSFRMPPAIFVIACLAAWRNVRLWYRQDADYEQALKEQEAGHSHNLHRPPPARGSLLH
jgi:hypothetical protein